MLIASGIFFTYFSKLIAGAILRDKREPNDADNAFIKLIGFVCILAAAITILI